MVARALATVVNHDSFKHSSKAAVEALDVGVLHGLTRVK